MSKQQSPCSRRFLRVAALTLSTLTTPIIAQADILTDECPAGIAVPADNELALTLYASGVQIYTCTATPTSSTPYTWVNTAEADLFKGNKKVGSHFFDPEGNPTWKIKGHEIKGTRVCAVDSPAGIPVGAPAAASIKWVLLSATPPATGRFHNVTFVQRINTVAGTRLPDYACNADHDDEGEAGHVLRKPYAANYLIHKQD